MEYCSFDAARFGFPKPRVPVLPSLAWKTFRWRSQEGVPDPSGKCRDTLFYSRGRYALLEAYRLCGVGPVTSILIPAYHCRTMLDPAIRLGAHVGLYPVTASLKPDLHGLRDCLRSSRHRAAALVLSHFFGFPQVSAELQELCAEYQLRLIEDCSHCMLPHVPSSQIGRAGHCGVSSPYKFFPSEDGGMLWASNGTQLPTLALQRQTAVTELKSVTHWLRRRAEANSRAPIATAGPSPALEIVPEPDVFWSSTGTSDQYNAALEGVAGMRASAWIISHTDTEAIHQLRIRNYLRWADLVSRLPNCKALYPELPADVTPYMFPLIVDHPDPHFFLLKIRGVPIWRWDDMAISDCPVAASYRTHLLHLPCHQNLSEAQMAWMASCVSEVIKSSPSLGVRRQASFKQAPMAHFHSENSASQ